MSRDVASESITEGAIRDDDVIYCAGCGEGITRERWRCQIHGRHDHTFLNPAGLMFNLQCFEDAPGIVEVGAGTSEYSWFTGYSWTIVICGGCDDHMGWRFNGAGQPPLFYALIANRLVKSSKSPS